jgi:hypothetical protein
MDLIIQAAEEKLKLFFKLEKLFKNDPIGVQKDALAQYK